MYIHWCMYMVRPDMVKPRTCLDCSILKRNEIIWSIECIGKRQSCHPRQSRHLSLKSMFIFKFNRTKQPHCIQVESALRITLERKHIRLISIATLYSASPCMYTLTDSFRLKTFSTYPHFYSHRLSNCRKGIS